MRLFLDLLPGHEAEDRAAALERGAERVRDRGPEWVEIRAPDDLTDLPERACLWVIPAEAGGEAGEVGALTLIRAAHETGRPWVVEGLGPVASAAALALGAAGVVLRVGAWLTEGSPLCEAHRDRLSRARSGRDTELVDGHRRLRGSGSVRVARWWSEPEAAVPCPQSVGTAWRAPTATALVDHARAELARLQELIREHHALCPDADPLGTGCPLVQGPMANIAEASGLARDVADAGAMPFAALGALRPEQAEAVLVDFAAALPDTPWGVGVIGFEMMPHRDAHLRAIEGLGPRGPTAVTLAGGSAALALALQERGLVPWLHTPSAALLARAADRGVGAVILEGRDAGGHVGALTSVGLWEEGLRAATDRDLLVVLAGGIGDPVSAAMAAAMAAPARASGVRVALQAGTAFLFTHEIAEHGQLTSSAQQAGLATRRTVLVGATVNLALRCAPNPFTEEARALEREWLAQELPLGVRRARLEAHNLGRTRVAAKGIERSPDWPERGPRYRPVPTARQRDEGAFSVGEGAVLTEHLSTVAEVVDALTRGAAALLQTPAAAPTPWPHPVPVVGGPRPERIPTATGVQLGGGGRAADDDGAIAIVGLGCVLPGAPDVDRFWHNLIHGVDAIGPVPERRWPAHRYHDPRGLSPSKSTARHAGVVHDLAFDPLAFRLPPAALPTVDRAQQLALLAASEAVRDAGWVHPDFDRSRAAVLLGNSMGGEHAKSLALRVRFREVLAALEEEGALDALPPEARDRWFARVEGRLDQQLPPIQADSMTGLLANVIAGRVASWLDWMGGNLTVDAACAASLASVAMAVDWLRTGRCDAVLAGGVDADLSPETFVGFSRTHALSATGSHPFSDHGDGFVMGEGAAVLALRRLSDARSRGEPVYAVIRGVGQSSDGRARGLTAPRPAGQRLAIQRAWAEAGVDARRLALVEAHGTGTAIGDATEATVLDRWLPEGEAPVWLGSVKSMIGHLKGGAGAAGLLKATVALAAGVAPPTLRAGPPHAALERSRLRLPRRPTRLAEERSAAVSAFGFGGTNFHVVLDRAPTDHPRASTWRGAAEPLLAAEAQAAWTATDHTPRVHCYGADSLEALSEAVASDRPSTPEAAAAATHRCIVLATPDRREATLRKVAAWLPTAGPADHLGQTAFRGTGPARDPVWLCPGQGSQRPGLDLAPRCLAPGARVLAEHPIPEALDERPLTLHRTLVPLALAWGRVLDDAAIPCAAALGHSLGELGALAATGRLSPTDALALAEARGQALEACPPGAMLATQLDPAEAERVAEEHGLELAALNGPERTVLAGGVAQVEAAAAHLSTLGRRHTRLDVGRAFHTASVAPAADALRTALDGVAFAGGPPVWSAARAERMEPTPDLVDAITSPVRFGAAIEGLVATGASLFVELGPGRTLSRLAEGVSEVRAIPLDPDPGDGGRGLVAAAAALLAEGYSGLLRLLPATLCDLALPEPEPAPPRRPVRGEQGLPEPEAETPPPPAQRCEPASWPVVDEDPIRAAVIEAVCDVSGYPPDFLEGDAELEAELGVDSIRKLEILGRLEDTLGFRVPESEYRVLERADIDTLTAFVRARVDAAPTEPAPPAPEEPTGGPGLYTWIEEPLPAVDPGPAVSPGTSRRGGTLSWARLEPGESGVSLREELLALRHALTSEVVRIEAVAPLDDPVARGVVGFLRSVARERGLGLRIVLADTPDARRLAPALADPALPETVVLRGSHLFTRRAVPFRPVAPPADHPVLWATGGLAGILGPILGALADQHPEVVVLGRTDPAADSARAAAHRDALEALRAAGLSVHWVRCDLSDPGSVATAVRKALALGGPPDLVLHGAGATADGPVEQLDPEALDRVLGPKIDGVEHLRARLPDARWLLLSSLAAVHGNPGQAGYAAANGALHGLPLRGSTVALTAWTERGMAADPTLQRVLARRGLVPVDPEPGAAATAALVRAVLADQAPREVLLLGAPPGSAPALPWPLQSVRSRGPTHRSIALKLDPTVAELDHHRVSGRPLVPAAVHIRALLSAGRALCSGAATALADFAIHAPVFVDAPRSDLSVHLLDGPLRAEIRAGEVTVAGARLVPSAPDEPLQLEPSGPGTTAPYGDALFHGPRWRALERVWIAEDHALADLALGEEDRLATAVDGAHQLLSLWSGAHTGWLGLPVGAARWTPAPGPWPAEARLLLSARPTDDGVEATVSVLDRSGGLLLDGRGVRLRRARPWPEVVDA